MSLITCKECKGQVSDTADKCPACGAKVPKKLSVLQWVGIGFLAFIIFSIFSAGNNSNTNTAVAVAPVPAESALRVTSVQIARDYEQNEARGDALYKGKLLHVTGVVQSVGKDFADDTFISLEGVNQFLTVHASLEASQEQKAINLQKNTPITVQCRGGGEAIGAPLLNECIIL